MNGMMARMDAYARLMRTDKPIGTYLVMWPMLWALWIAGAGHPDGFVLMVFMLGAFLMRSAGCVINDFADRKVDGSVDRTKARPLVTGEVSSIEALVLFAALVLMAFLLVLLMNTLTLQLAFGAFGLAVLYPFMKRITHLPQLFLGFAFAWSIPMAFAAVQNVVPLHSWLLYLATILWVVAYDTMYAMVDRDDDVKVGIKSTAILFGRFDRVMVAVLQIAMVLTLAWLGKILALGVLYYFGLCLALALAAYQQFLIRNREKDACFRAFLNNHYLGALVFLGLFLDYAVRF